MPTEFTPKVPVRMKRSVKARSWKALNARLGRLGFIVQAPGSPYRFLSEDKLACRDIPGTENP